MSSITLEQISYELQNPSSEAARLAAWGELQEYRTLYPESTEAQDLYLKYKNLGRDWTEEVVSVR